MSGLDKDLFLVGEYRGPRSPGGSQLYEHPRALEVDLKKEILGDLGLIPGKFHREKIGSVSSSRRHNVLSSGGYASMHMDSMGDNQISPVSHFIEEGGNRGRHRRIVFPAAKRKLLLPSTASCSDLAQRLQTLQADKSPFLKSLVFDTERPSSLRYRTPDNDPKESALVGALAGACLVFRLQRFSFRAGGGAVLDFGGSLSVETIGRTKFRSETKELRRLAALPPPRSLFLHV
jgi:hypothetical protein